ncbi:YkvA family protein [Halomarina ordinaria]|uniref:YkvA family protein n=1 Tax=Halomarina ordinaria TaxID=3033939 RepID=A0ABD5UDB5_9EURY|nr:DUF1232 domain-containing protein [Halomarina sp. PSRA2]
MLRRLTTVVVEAYVLVRVALDRRTPNRVAALVALAAAYLVVPVDLLPDAIPLLGWGDDLLFGVLVQRGVGHVVPDAVVEEHREAARDRVWLAAGLVASALALSLVGAVLVVRWLGWL